MKYSIIIIMLLVASVAGGQVSGCPTGTHGNCVTWTLSPTSGVTGQIISRSIVPGGEMIGTPLCTVSPTVTQCLDTSGVPGVLYYYVGWAGINGLESPVSNEKSGTFPTVPAPLSLVSVVPQ